MRQSIEPAAEAAVVLELGEAALDAIAQLVDQRSCGIWVFRTVSREASRLRSR